MHVFHRTNAPAYGQGHEALVRGAFNDINDRSTAVRAGGDVKEDHFIGTLLIVAQSKFHGIPYIAQLTRFRAAKLHTARYLTAMHVQTGNDSFRQHLIAESNKRRGGWWQVLSGGGRRATDAHKRR